MGDDDPKQTFRTALLRLVEATGTAAQARRARETLESKDRPDLGPIGLLANVQAVFQAVSSLVDNDSAADSLLLRLLHAKLTLDRVSPWPNATPEVRELQAAGFRVGFDEDGEVYARPPGPGAHLFFVARGAVTPLGGTLDAIAAREVEALVQQAPQRLRWFAPELPDYQRLARWADSVEHLAIAGGAIGDTGVEQIMALRKLRAIKLVHVEGASEERVARLAGKAGLVSLLVDETRELVGKDLDAEPQNRFGKKRLKNGSCVVIAGKRLSGSRTPRAYHRPELDVMRALAERAGLVVCGCGEFSPTQPGPASEASWPILVGVGIEHGSEPIEIPRARLDEALAAAARVDWRALAAAADAPDLARVPPAVRIGVIGKLVGSKYWRANAKEGETWLAQALALPGSAQQPLADLPASALQVTCTRE